MISDAEAISLAAEITTDILSEDDEEDGCGTGKNPWASLDDDDGMFHWIDGDDEAVDKSMLNVLYENG